MPIALPTGMTTYSVPARFGALFRILCALGEIGRAEHARLNPRPVVAAVEDRTGACCERAVRVPCVCVAGWECPAHGWRHVGSHE